jgi:hypothetical protein
VFVGLVDTRGDRDRHDSGRRDPLVLDIPELRPWRWYLATIICMVVSGYVTSWLSGVLVIAGLCFFFQALTSYYKGNDGLSRHRQ